MTEDESRKVPRPLVVLGALAVIQAILGATLYALGPERTAGLFGLKTKPEPKEAGIPIGGPFTLVDQSGETRTEKDFRGRFMLIYFGYTYCPDICPTTLTTMADALKKLGADAEKITPIFITVDPKRDTVAQLKMYVSHFHPRLVGLTGTESQVAAAAKAYRVYSTKQAESAPGADDYLVDHTSITYLMGPDGKFLTHFGHGVTAEAMAERIRQYL